MVDFFFFQAEDGIRVTSVTGVQTCALPISRYGLLLMAKVGVFAVILAAAAVARRSVRRATVPRTRLRRAVATELTLAARSEERRVGKEWRSRGWSEP